jgi:translation initiation factor IF-1
VAKSDIIKMTGKIEEVLPNATFRIVLNDTQHKIIATLGGKLRQHNIRILLGDIVEVEMSPYDMNRGRVVYRNK